MSDTIVQYQNQQHTLNSEDTPEWLSSYRKESIDKFVKSGFPTRKMEDWRKNDISALTKTLYNLPAVTEAPHHDMWWNKTLTEGFHISMVNGVAQYDTSAVPTGVSLYNSKDLQDNKELLAHISKREDRHNSSFTDLNAGLLQDILVISISADSTVKTPLVIEHQVVTENATEVHAQQRIVVIGEKNSSAEIIETYCGSDSKYFVNSVMDILLHESAILRHIKLQNESLKGNHVSSLSADLEGKSHLSSHLLQLGAAFSRNDINVSLNGEEASCNFHGLYLGQGDQVHDTHCLVHHRVPRCESKTQFRSILDDSSKCMFNGKVHVVKDAQQTNATQKYATLLLTDTARIYTEPQLEVYADDVACAHGATIGQLDKKQLFYLQSRGFDYDSAKAMLVGAFAAETMEQLPHDALREEVDLQILNRMER